MSEDGRNPQNAKSLYLVKKGGSNAMAAALLLITVSLLQPFPFVTASV